MKYTIRAETNAMKGPRTPGTTILSPFIAL